MFLRADTFTKISDQPKLAYRFKARLIVRGFEMEKGKDYLQNFSPTPGIAIARIITSIAAANDLELQSIDIEQAFLHPDKLMEVVNDVPYVEKRDIHHPPRWKNIRN